MPNNISENWKGLAKEALRRDLERCCARVQHGDHTRPGCNVDSIREAVWTQTDHVVLACV